MKLRAIRREIQTANLRIGRTVTVVAVASATLGISVAGCASSDAPTTAATRTVPVVADAWSRKPVPGQTTAAIYAVIENPSDHAVTLTSASTPLTDRAEIHETTVNADGSMSMAQPKGGLNIPAGGSLELAPGGSHVMLFGIDPASYPTTVQITFEFDGAEPVTTRAEVRDTTGGSPNMSATTSP